MRLSSSSKVEPSHARELKVRGEWPPKGRGGRALHAFLVDQGVVGPDDFFRQLHYAIDAAKSVGRQKQIMRLGEKYSRDYRFDLPFTFQLERTALAGRKPISPNLRNLLLTYRVRDSRHFRDCLLNEIEDVEREKKQLELDLPKLKPYLSDEDRVIARGSLITRIQRLKAALREFHSLVPAEHKEDEGEKHPASQAGPQ